ncbi:DUF1772 domain-containing protein [Arthrobacter sp. JZ12]|uniref:anthrone oxygenase family protein n=1 Tax=Arthrobacter sp. JZ12 TaxID=2654190 RepID=UPI002B47C602|nr:anthrone oxygenase family protein [Arthrobacter sp. JZ12]WRH26264.1 DUF1772 domain-containing protein [Arthrobacter sp. JZ12]
MHTTVLVLATASMGLIAGLFYAFSVSVMPGLRRIGDQPFVQAMGAINTAIQNLWFAVSFFGALLFTAWALVLQVSEGTPRLFTVATALILYVAVLGITFTINIPLNLELERSASAQTGGSAAARLRFEKRWVGWNHLRTLLSFAAFILLCTALVSPPQ